jgi:O-antigen/teichoic acid export membrane protein
MQEPGENSRAFSALYANATGRIATAWRQGRQALGLLRLTSFDTSTPEGRSLERYRRIALTTVSGMTARGLGSLLGLVSVPLLLGYLGKERFGLWAIITTLMAWVALFDLGMANGLVNMLSAAHGREEKEAAGEYLSTAFFSLLAVSLVLAVIVVVALGLVPWGAVLGAKAAADEPTVRWSVGAALGIFVLSLPFSVTQQVYAAYQRTYIWNGFALLGASLGFAGLLVCIHLRASMPLLILGSGIAIPLATIAAYVYATGRALPWLGARLHKVSRAALRGLLARSVPIFLYQIGALVVNETQSILLAHRCDLATVAAYSVTMRVYLVFIAVIQIGTNSFIPALREAHERGDRDWTTRAFARLLRVRIGIAAAGGLLVVLLGNVLLALWLRRTDIAFGKSTWLAMAALMIGAMWSTSYAELLSIMDRLWINVVAVFANGTISLVLTYFLAPRYQVMGALLALAIPTALITIFLRVFGRRLLAAVGGRAPG